MGKHKSKNKHDPTDTTHVRVSYENIARMKEIGRMGYTINKVVTILLDEYEKNHPKSKE